MVVRRGSGGMVVRRRQKSSGIVDIDAMFQRDSALNWALITRICELPVKVQLVGGHLEVADIERAFQAGVSRVMIDGTQADVNLLASSAVSSFGPDSIGVMFTTRAVGKSGVIGESEDWPEDWAGGAAEPQVRLAARRRPSLDRDLET